MVMYVNQWWHHLWPMSKWKISPTPILIKIKVLSSTLYQGVQHHQRPLPLLLVFVVPTSLIFLQTQKQPRLPVCEGWPSCAIWVFMKVNNESKTYCLFLQHISNGDKHECSKHHSIFTVGIFPHANVSMLAFLWSLVCDSTCWTACTDPGRMTDPRVPNVFRLHQHCVLLPLIGQEGHNSPRQHVYFLLCLVADNLLSNPKNTIGLIV